MKYNGRRIVLYILPVILLTLIVLSFTIGRYSISLQDIFSLISYKFDPLNANNTANEAVEKIIFNIRLPRIILAVLVGSGLSLAGASYQGVFRNPMASPDILGASSGAAFGAALMIMIGGKSRFVSLSAFAFSIITVFIVYIIGQKAPGRKIINLILAGMMLSSLCSAGTSYVKLVADPYNKLPEITYWLMGSLANSSMDDVAVALIPILICTVLLLLLRWKMNLLVLDDEEALSMGVNVTHLRLIVILLATIITAVSVSVSGMISWVGLVCPHICRKIVGNNFRQLLPASIFFGGSFLLIIDDISRNIFTTEIPIGILTSFLGVPFFIYLMFKRESNYA